MRKLWTLAKLAFDRFTDAIPYLVIIYLAYAWIPVIWRHSQQEGQHVEAFALDATDGRRVSLESPHQPLALVFWATWCGPCTIELSRIQRLVEKKQIAKDSIVAITDENPTERVLTAISERGYSFPVAFDRDSALMRRFKIDSTPTIVVLGSDNQIAWITSGLSPTLELRLRSLLPSVDDNRP